MALGFMQKPPDGGRPETPVERERRIQQEAVVIEQARAESRAGQGVTLEVAQVWLDELDRDENAPIPTPAAPYPFGR